jgi:hypothetical protein
MASCSSLTTALERWKRGTAEMAPKSHRYRYDISVSPFPETFQSILVFLKLQQEITKSLKAWIPIQQTRVQAPNAAVSEVTSRYCRFPPSPLKQDKDKLHSRSQAKDGVGVGVRLGIGLPFGAHVHILYFIFLSFDSYIVVLPRAPSLTIGCVCNLQCNRWLVRSLRTNNHTLPSHLRLCSLYVASYGSQELRWRYSNKPPHGEEWDLSTISYIGIQFVPDRNHITSF